MNYQVEISMEWNDDERDTSARIMSRENACKSHTPKGVCEILKELYDEQKESRFTWTRENYDQEVEKRRSKLILPKTVIQEAPKLQNNQEEDEEEVNDDLMEKAIYRKCWYS